jgi:hypothetical protein
VLNKKNITRAYLTALFCLFNLPVIYYIEKAIDWFAWQYHSKVFSFLFSVLFFVTLFFINRFIFFKGLKKWLKRIIQKYILKTRYYRNSSIFFLIFIALFFLFLFRLWNIDLIVEQRYHEVVRVFGPVIKFNRNVIDELKIVWGNAPIETKDTEAVLNTDKYDSYGRFLRTSRWHNTIRKAEQRYHIEENLIAGLIMQESMGNPLELNSMNDGGAGLLMFQPGTARQYKLKTYGSSNATGRDVAHGKQLLNIVIQKKFNYPELSGMDERFNVEKSINAGAQFLSDLYDRHHSWDKALSAYNRGTPSYFPAASRHVRLVRQYQLQYSFFLKKQKASP